MKRLAAVFAHPDDDTFALAGTYALHADELELLVVVATSGEAGMIADPSLATRENLGPVREGEERAALAAAGVHEPQVVFLRYPDGGLKDVDREELVGRVAERLREFRPDVVVSFGPNGVTEHEDHIAIHRVAREAFDRCRRGTDGGFRRLLYSCLPESEIERFRELQRMAGLEPFDPDEPFTPKGVPDADIAVRVDMGPVVKTKIAALLEHRTQAEELQAIPDQFMPVVFANEHYAMGWPERRPDEPILRDVFEKLT